MSWQDYIDHQLLSTKCVNQAAIVGHDGNVWASSPDFKVSQPEALRLIDGFKDPSIFQAEGVTIAGNRYIYLSGNDKIVRAKKLKVGVHCMKTKQAVVISTYADPIQPQQAASAVEGLGDYLVKCGY